MSLIILGSQKGRSPNAFSDGLDCPYCKGHYPDYNRKKQKWKYDRNITPTRIRYICKHCKNPVQYDFSK